MPRKECVFRGQNPLLMNYSDEQLKQRYILMLIIKNNSKPFKNLIHNAETMIFWILSEKYLYGRHVLGLAVANFLFYCEYSALKPQLAVAVLNATPFCFRELIYFKREWLLINSLICVIWYKCFFITPFIFVTLF